MTASRPKLLVLAVSGALLSCAQPPATPPAPAPVVEKPAATPPAPPKPVRMNGRGKISSISLTDLFELQQSDKVLLFDARPYFYHTLSHIPGAISMPKENCDREIVKREAEIKAALAAGKTIVVYCTNFTCPDARTVAIHLAGYGYPSSTLPGGWDAWKESGLPTE